MRKLRASAIILFGAVWASSTLAANSEAGPSAGVVAEQPTVRWQVIVVPAAARPGDEVEVVFTAEIAPGWILYSSDFQLDIGPRPTRFTFDTSSSLALVGAIQPVQPQWKNDRTLGGKYSYFSQHAQFRQKARLIAPLGNVTGRISGQTCFEESGLCKLFAEMFSTRR